MVAQSCSRRNHPLYPLGVLVLSLSLLLRLCCVLQAFLLRKLKLNGSMGLALKLQPILDAASPRAKL